MTSIRPELALDFYKTGHRPQYPDGTTSVYSNFTARSSAHFGKPPLFDEKVVNFGWQAFSISYLINLWDDEFFSMPKDLVLGRYKRRMDEALGPNAVSTGHIEALHDLGYLPIRLKALPEGARVNMRVALATVHETLPEFYWLTNYIETALSAEMWKKITVATIAYEYHRQLKHWQQVTGSAAEFLPWQNHDFSLRGMSGLADGASSGAAHLLSSYGTDTVPALDFIEDYYSGSDLGFLGGSVPATEHSVMCMGGKDDELGTFDRLITKLYPAGIVSIVSDTWDFWNVMTVTAPALKDKIMARDGKVVFRPDSGDPVKILTGYKCRKLSSHDELNEQRLVNELEDLGIEAVQIGDNYRELSFHYWPDGSIRDAVLGKMITEAEAKGAVECLWDTFGGTLTDKGFKTLDSHVGLIYGDSITLQRQWQILSRLAAKGFSAGNVVFGIGSYTYQYITRDTFGMAVKATWGMVDGEARELSKDPKTDTGVKKSAKGLIRVEKVGDDYVQHDQQTPDEAEQGELRTIFEDGQLVLDESFTAIRARLGAVV